MAATAPLQRTTWAMLALMAIAASAVSGAARAHDASAPGALTLASEGAFADSENVRQLARRLERGLGAYGIERVSVEIVDDHADLVALLKDERADIVLSYGLIVAEAMTRMTVQPVLQTSGATYGEQHTIIAAHADSDVRALADLTGRRVAFKGPLSNGGFFAPAWVMAGKGLALSYQADVRAAPPADAVAAVFTGAPENMTQWLYRGIADAAAYGARDWRDAEDAPAQARARFRVIVGEAVALHGYVVLASRRAADLSTPIAEALAAGGSDFGAFVPLAREHEERLRAVSAVLKKERLRSMSNLIEINRVAETAQ